MSLFNRIRNRNTASSSINMRGWAQFIKTSVTLH